MDSSDLIGMISGGLVVVSAIPYGIHIVLKTVKPNMTSWSLWSLIGISLLVTYKDSGAGANVWPAIFGVSNPIILLILAYFCRGKREPFTIWDKLSLVGCLGALSLWAYVHGDKEGSAYALYLGILADLFAAIPTILFVWNKPAEEKPAGWIIYAIGYGLGAFAVTEHSFSNYILPIYMFSGSLTIVYPLVVYRIRKKIPLRQWV